MPVAKQAGAERERRRLTFHQQILLALLSVNALVMLLIGSLFYVEQRAALFKDMDARLTSVAISAREMLPPDYHDRITGPDSVSEEEFQKNRRAQQPAVSKARARVHLEPLACRRKDRVYVLDVAG